MRTRSSAVLLALAITVLPACTRTTPEEKAQQAAVDPYLNVLSRDARAVPSVTCAQALLPGGGVPGGEQSDIIAVDLRVDLPLADPRVDGVLEQVGELVWRSPLPVLRLRVTAFGGGVHLGPDGRASTERTDPLTVDELTALYGPRPPLPATLPPIQDPGLTSC